MKSELLVSCVDENRFTERIRIARSKKFLVEFEGFVDVTGGRAQQRHQIGKAEVRQFLHVRIDQDFKRPITIDSIRTQSNKK